VNDSTRIYLRNATLEALSKEDDSAAMELLSILTGQSELPQPEQRTTLALPQARPLMEGDAHDYHFWARFIRDSFLPFMLAHGRYGFTSYELTSWLEAHPELPLTTGDVEAHSNGRETWRSQISAALQGLKRMGCINAPLFGRTYEINRPQLKGSA
jgi:hypothetical protein